MKMKLDEIEKNLVKELEKFEIIDCHEHLLAETEHIGIQKDVFSLFSHYTQWDLRVAGMKENDYKSLFDTDMPLDRRWAVFSPFWQQIRHTSYARAAILASQKFYGVETIDGKTYEPLSAAIRMANKAGIYKKVLTDACNIRTALNVSDSTETGSKLLTPVMPMAYATDTWDELTSPPFKTDNAIKTLDDYIEACKAYIAHIKSKGAVGVKMVSIPYGTPDRDDAVRIFECLRNGTVTNLHTPKWPDYVNKSNALRDYIIDRQISHAAGQDLTIAVHTGYWGDFRNLHPLHMLPVIRRHPEARFDIFHLGYPWVRETLMLGKGCENVWINFCWLNIVSQVSAAEAYDEAIDLLPANKVLAFGGDYYKPVEKVYGHLVMARENMAKALAKRIMDGRMTETQALELANKWLWDNPVELYRLNQKKEVS
ncbi:MAG: hypothetical protein FIA99_14810 [Ruminiclostridium sp.]|nr:hypothetical protein [Ruminiclostridium sp.]